MKKYLFAAGLALFPILARADMSHMGTDKGLFDDMGYIMHGTGIWGLVHLVLILVWIGVGILACMWLWQNTKHK